MSSQKRGEVWQVFSIYWKVQYEIKGLKGMAKCGTIPSWIFFSTSTQIYIKIVIGSNARCSLYSLHKPLSSDTIFYRFVKKEKKTIWWNYKGSTYSTLNPETNFLSPSEKSKEQKFTLIIIYEPLVCTYFIKTLKIRWHSIGVGTFWVPLPLHGNPSHRTPALGFGMTFFKKPKPAVIMDITWSWFIYVHSF